MKRFSETLPFPPKSCPPNVQFPSCLFLSSTIPFFMKAIRFQVANLWSLRDNEKHHPISPTRGWRRTRARGAGRGRQWSQRRVDGASGRLDNCIKLRPQSVGAARAARWRATRRRSGANLEEGGGQLADERAARRWVIITRTPKLALVSAPTARGQSVHFDGAREQASGGSGQRQTKTLPVHCFPSSHFPNAYSIQRKPLIYRPTCTYHTCNKQVTSHRQLQGAANMYEHHHRPIRYYQDIWFIKKKKKKKTTIVDTSRGPTKSIIKVYLLP